MEDEKTSLVVSPKKAKPAAAPDWSRFGLSSSQSQPAKEGGGATSEGGGDEVFDVHGGTVEQNELFKEDQSGQDRPWWKTNFFISEPVLFGTWDGVFTSCMINIFGVIIFLRSGWMVGNAGIGLSVLIIFLTMLVALVAMLSGIGVCERCRMQTGGVYFLLSHVLGSKTGASVGMLYCFGQAVSCSLSVVGFGESVASLFGQTNEWIARGIGAAVIVLLLGINMAGVMWVIRFQLVLLLILFIAVLDFLVGSFVHTEPESGFVGYDNDVFVNNTAPEYQPGESFFTVFGVFFPAVTGIFAGINMSGDLRNPSKNIPVGTLAAIGVSTVLNLSFLLVLGGTCLRFSLQTDYMIAEKVSILGIPFLTGLYVSSISGCMGALYGSPRILQSIANDNVIPVIRFLGHGRGPNKLPMYSMLAITAVAILFVFIGNMNTLGPVVTMPFMITYAAVDYAYFALAISYDRVAKRHALLGVDDGAATATRSAGDKPTSRYGTLGGGRDTDLDTLFPSERDPLRERPIGGEGQRSGEGEATFDRDPDLPQSDSMSSMATSGADSTTGFIGQEHLMNAEITKQPQSFYSMLCNRWVSLLGVLACVVIMFAIQWIYALVNIACLVLVYVYIGIVNPGMFPGIAEFSIVDTITDGIRKCCRKGKGHSGHHVISSSDVPAVKTSAAQLTEDNEDFADRVRYHQSEVIKGQNFDSYYQGD